MRNLHEPRHAARRIISVIGLVLALAFATNAYTIVTNGGRHLEIPSKFVVTGSTLTYEVSPGVQVTLLIAAIDIPATEMANHEQPGSFLRRVGVTSAEPTSSAEITTTPARRTITNRDLEPTASRRRHSEVAYEQRRKQLGLPSVEESREQAAAESELIERELDEQRLADSKTEDYWRERATALRTEMAATDAEIAWIRARLDEVPVASNSWNGFDNWSTGSSTTVIGINPFGRFGGRARNSWGNTTGNFGGNFGGRGRFDTGRSTRPGVFVAPGAGPQIGATRRRGFPDRGFRPARRYGIGGSPVIQIYPNAPVFGSYPTYDYSNERGDLITRFNELAGARAGLNARWRELEEAARRAGASPGWLRP